MPQKGQKMTEEQKAFRREVMKAKWQQPGYRENMSSKLMGHEVTAEAREKMSESRKGKPLSDEHKQVLRERSKQLWQSEEYRDKVVAAINTDEAKAKQVSPEINAKKSAGKLKYWQTKTKEERVAAMRPYIEAGAAGARIKLKGRKFSPEILAKMVESHKRTLEDPEARKRLSDGQKQAWLEKSPENREKQIKHLRIVSRSIGRISNLERMVMGALDSLSIKYISQYKIGRYSVDLYLPEQHLVIECDGSYWHSLPDMIESDAKRDAYVTKEGYRVIRLGEKDIRKSVTDLVKRSLGLE